MGDIRVPLHLPWNSPCPGPIPGHVTRQCDEVSTAWASAPTRCYGKLFHVHMLSISNSLCAVPCLVLYERAVLQAVACFNRHLHRVALCCLVCFQLRRNGRYSGATAIGEARAHSCGRTGDARGINRCQTDGGCAGLAARCRRSIRCERPHFHVAPSTTIMMVWLGFKAGVYDSNY